MNKLFFFFVSFSLILLFFPSLILSQDYFAPNMLIPKKVYQDETYDVPRLNRVKSNQLFGWEIFSRTPHFPLATVVNYPGGMTSHKYLMVTDLTWNRIIISDEWNDWLTRYGDRGGGNEQFWGPHGISSLGAEVFFIADTYNDRVAYGDVSGDPPVIWWRGTYTGLNYPLDVDARPKTIYNTDPLVVVADAKNHRVMLYEHPNHSACSYTKDRDNEVQFVYPTSLCFGRDNGAQNLRLYVTDQGLHKVFLFSLLFSGGCPDLVHGQSYEFPPGTYLSAVDVDNKGLVYVVDSREGKVYKFKPLLDLIAVWGGKGVEDNLLLSPTGISIAHGMDCTDYPDPCTPITDLADVFITEYWTDQTGVRRFILGVDVLNFSANYVPPVVDDSNWLVGGNYIEYEYYTTDYANVSLIIDGPGVMDSRHWYGLEPGAYGGTWDVGDNSNGTYTVTVTAFSLYTESNHDSKSMDVEVDKTLTTQAPIIVEGPYFVGYPPRICYGSSYTVRVDAFDPDDEGIYRYDWTTGRCCFENGQESISTWEPENSVWLDIRRCPGSGRISPAVNYKPMTGTPDYIEVEVVDVDGASTGGRNVFTPEDCSEPGNGGGCPFVSVWNEAGFEEDNTILAASELNPGQPVTDYYLLSKPLTPTGKEYRLQISEFENEISYIDQVRLAAVDHNPEIKVAVTPDGKIFGYDKQLVPVACVDQDGRNHLLEIKNKDGVYFASDEPGYLLVTYSTRTLWPDVLYDPPPIEGDGSVPPWQKRAGVVSHVTVEVQDIDGVWHEVGEILPRMYPERSYWIVETGDVELGEEFKVRISWDNYYAADELKYYIRSQEQPLNIWSHPVSAFKSGGREILKEMLNTDKEYATLRPGQTIDLSFPVPSYPEPGMVRDFVFQTTGYYVSLKKQSVAPKSFALLNSYPNPFNARTVISYTLPRATDVKLQIFNVLGQRVKVLLDEHQSAGYRSVVWDGKNDEGVDLSSGIYFYRLQTKSYSDSKKMVLIR